jgi:predicted nucleic acid-binding protein
MKVLLDRNVLSEPARPARDPAVVAWLRAQRPLDLVVSVLAFGETAKGVALFPPGRRRADLERWFAADLPRQFAGRVLPVDTAVAVAWGRLTAEGRQHGRELPVVDGLLLATATVHGLAFATRHERDCAGRGVPVVNAWTGAAS